MERAHYINPIGGATSIKSDFLTLESPKILQARFASAEVMAAHSFRMSILHFILHHTPEELSLSGKGSLVMGR